MSISVVDSNSVDTENFVAHTLAEATKGLNLNSEDTARLYTGMISCVRRGRFEGWSAARCSKTNGFIYTNNMKYKDMGDKWHE